MSVTEKALLLVDDHALFRSGLKGLLESVHPEFSFAEVADGQSAINEVGQKHYDLVILDCELPDITGSEVLKAIRKQAPDMPVVMLTGIHSGQLIRELLELGATAVLAKRGNGDELLAVVDGELTDAYVSNAFRADLEKSAVFSDLTPKEQQTLRLLLEGFSTKQIAEELNVSPKTSETHRTSIMSKLGVHSYGELVRLARDSGLIRSSQPG